MSVWPGRAVVGPCTGAAQKERAGWAEQAGHQYNVRVKQAEWQGSEAQPATQEPAAWASCFGLPLELLLAEVGGPDRPAHPS